MAARFDSGSFESYGAVEAAGTDVTVPDANLLFKGAYSRSGSDLLLTGSDGAKFVVTGYFETDTPPNLLSPEGAMLTGDVVTALAGPQFPGQYALAGGSPQGAESIGSVQTLQGGATVVRANGTTETLNVGDPVFQGDVVQTGPGAKLGLSFVDGTVFSMSANARMVLDSLIYNPGASDNSMLFSLVEGAFVFTAGAIAPTGNMNIKTPVATMGIRGTTPTVDINALTGQVQFSVVPDPRDGHEGQYVLKNLFTDQIMASVTGTESKWELTSTDGTVTEIPKSEQDLLNDQAAIGEITTVFNTAQSNNNQPQQQGDPNDITNSIPNGPPPSGGLNTGAANTGPEGNTPPGNTPPPGPPEGDPPPGDTTPPTGPTTNNDPPPVTGGGPPVTSGPTEITGTTGVDNPLDGTEGDDLINGLAGDDTINALGGNDIITISPGGGADIVDGGAGNDRLIISEDSGFVFNGGDGIDVLEIAGDLNIDTRTFISEAENIEIIDLNKTHDNIFTAQVEDFITPGTSNIIQFRGGATDGGGNDVLNVGSDLVLDNGQQIDGSWQQAAGIRVIDGIIFDVWEFRDAADEVYATAEVERGIEFNLVPIADEIGDQSAKVNKSFTVAVAAFFVDLDQAQGETLEFSATLSDGSPLPQWLTFDTQTGTFSGTPGSGDADVLNIDVTAIDAHGASVTEDFTLRVGNIGSDRTNIKFGSNGDDVIAGLGGADLIFGRGGNDQLFGDGGRDLIFGGSGKDTIHGGDGRDILNGDSGNDQIFGDDGNDLISGGSGNDTIRGGEGNDTLSGNKGNDIIYGDAGNDTLLGGKGNDILAGGLGNDTLYGGSGSDAYLFMSLLEGVDTIKDFDLQQDVLDLSGLLGLVFDPQGEEPLSDYVQTSTDNGDTTVSVDLDGQGLDHGPVDIAVLQGVDAGTINIVVNDEDTTGAVVV